MSSRVISNLNSKDLKMLTFFKDLEKFSSFLKMYALEKAMLNLKIGNSGINAEKLILIFRFSI